MKQDGRYELLTERKAHVTGERVGVDMCHWCCLEGKVVKVKCSEEGVTKLLLVRQTENECLFKSSIRQHRRETDCCWAEAES